MIISSLLLLLYEANLSNELKVHHLLLQLVLYKKLFLFQEAEKSTYQPEKFKVINFEELMKNCIPFEEVNETFWEDFITKKEK